MTRVPVIVALSFALCVLALWAGSAVSAADDGTSLSKVIYPPQDISLTFSHARHTSEDCTSCHTRAAISRSSLDRLIPGEPTCARCHDIDRSRPDASCASCHSGFSPGQPVGRVQIPIPNLKFSHQAHAERGIACGTCHARVATGDLATRADLPDMDLCLECHDGTQARDQCALCHLAKAGELLVTSFPEGQLVPESGAFGAPHTALFVKRHQNAAVNSGALCESCHKQSFCIDCHTGSLTAMKFHPPGYLSFHGTEARRNTPDCSACHRRQTFCVGCHSRSGVVADGRATSAFSKPGEGGGGRFHPLGWVAQTMTGGGHGIAARRNIQSCASCHREEHCTRCHTAEPGSMRANPHPPGWAQSRRCRALLSKNKRLCLRCHIDPAEVSCAWRGGP